MRWTLSDGKLRRSTDAGVNWEIVPIDQNSVFRALSVLGEELWVGGKNGVLYHSPDNGKHWVHVVPTAGEELLTEDIVRLEFADADHGKLITPHSEWTTENLWRDLAPSATIGRCGNSRTACRDSVTIPEASNCRKPRKS